MHTGRLRDARVVVLNDPVGPSGYVGDTPHTATSFEPGKVGKWDTGVLEKGQSKTVTFSEPGNYYYICAPHPWMYGQVIVE